MLPKSSKYGLPHGKKASVRRKKAPYMNLFQGWRSSASTCPPGSPMSESDNKINNIFRNYSLHNYIEILSRMHPMHYLTKIFSEEHTLESFYAPHDNASKMYYNTSPLSQIFPHTV